MNMKRVAAVAALGITSFILVGSMACGVLTLAEDRSRAMTRKTQENALALIEKEAENGNVQAMYEFGALLLRSKIGADQPYGDTTDRVLLAHRAIANRLNTLDKLQAYDDEEVKRTQEGLKLVLEAAQRGHQPAVFLHARMMLARCEDKSDEASFTCQTAIEVVEKLSAKSCGLDRYTDDTVRLLAKYFGRLNQLDKSDMWAIAYMLYCSKDQLLPHGHLFNVYESDEEKGDFARFYALFEWEKRLVDGFRFGSYSPMYLPRKPTVGEANAQANRMRRIEKMLQDLGIKPIPLPKSQTSLAGQATLEPVRGAKP